MSAIVNTYAHRRKYVATSVTITYIKIINEKLKLLPIITAWLPESPPDGFNDAGLRIETSPGTRKSSSHASNIITDMHVNAGNDADQIDTHDHAGVRSNEMSP